MGTEGNRKKSGEDKNMVEAKKGEEKVEKGYKFKCAGCGIAWEHKVKKTSGLCKVCVELRRAVQSFINKGLTKVEVMTRLDKVLKG